MTSNNKEIPTFENLIKLIQKNKHFEYKYPLSYYKRLDEQIRNHENRVKYLDMRRRILKNQRSSNYQNEYDKVKSILDHVTLPKGLNPEYYKNRFKYLEDMGAHAFDQKNN